MIPYKFAEREYHLINRDNGNTLIMGGTDPNTPSIPKNYKEVENTLVRNLETYGVITSVSSEYEFVTESADFLRSAYNSKDIEANVDLIEYRFHPDTDVKYIYNTSNADFSVYTSTKNSVMINFKSSGLNSTIKSKKKEKYDIERLTDIQGNTISSLTKTKAALTTREILLLSELKTADSDNLTSAFRMDFRGGNLRTLSVSIPAEINFKSDERVTPQIINQRMEDRAFLTASSVFYLNNDRRKLINVSIELNYVPVYLNVSDLSNNATFQVLLDTTKNGLSLEIDDSKRRVLYQVVGDGNIVQYFNNRVYTSISFNQDIILEQGESLGLVWYGIARFGGIFDDGRFDVNFKDVECKINLTENSTFTNSQTDCILMKDVGSQFLKIFTGQEDSYVSDFFKNGDFKYSALALGLWIRRFSDKKMEISWDEFIKNSNALFLMGYTIDSIDGKDRVIHEPIDYFFQNFIFLEIDERVSDVKRSALSDEAFTSLKFGYKKPSGDNLYEEAQGLDEPNIANSYGTPITRVDNIYDKTSDFRADSYGKEFARRKSIETNPTDDTRYDKTKFVLDLKESVGTVLEERVWQDDFESAPTGVYSPNSITGLRISPMNNLLRHGKVLRSFLNKFPSKNIIFNNSVGNELMTTHPIGGVERAENSSVLVNDLDLPLFVNEVIEFKAKVTYELQQKIYGRTIIGERSIPNFFGRIRFTNEFGQKEEGYLLELSPNNEGNWKLIKSA